MRRSSNWLRGLVAAAFFAALAAPAFAQQSDLDPLAKRIAGKLKSGPARVIIAGFLDARDLRSPLGVQLASEFADALHRASPGLESVSRDEFTRVRREGLWTEDDARGFGVLRTLAQELGARFVITGWYERSNNSLRLTVQVFDFQKNRRVAESSAALPLTAERARLDDQIFALRQREKDPAPPPLSADLPPEVFQPGKNGVGVPECLRCPDPSFTKEARSEKYVGRVLLRIVVTPDGRAANIRVVKGAKHGLTEAAVKAVEKWRFKPALQDGKPVSVQVDIEVTFRLL